MTRPSLVCTREPERSFCSDCPDHEACSTGVPVTLVRSFMTCWCGQPNDTERVHRAHECLPWVTRQKGSSS